MKNIIEALKEICRVSVLAVIPIAIDGLSTGGLNLRLIGITFAIAVLRGVDKWLHEKGKDEFNENMQKGLTRF